MATVEISFSIGSAVCWLFCIESRDKSGAAFWNHWSCKWNSNQISKFTI